MLFVKNILVLLLFFCLTTVTAQSKNEKLLIDANFPGGNIIVQRISGDTVYLHQNLHDTEGNWFYWSFRVRGASSKKLHFVFVHPWNGIKPIPVVGAKGPAISRDKGQTWKWLDQIPYTKDSFTYQFTKQENDVYFGMGMNYTETHLKSFMSKVAGHPHLEQAVLATTRQGRTVEKLHIGNLRSTPRFKVLLTARHHACEMMGSYVLEGMIEELLSTSKEANWLREHVEFMIVPFVDKDGVEQGEQGKNRRGRDHNRDYSGESIYASTKALRAFVPVWAGNTPLLGIDIHCPYISGGVTNETVYMVGGRDMMLAQAESQFAIALEKQTKLSGKLPYEVKNNIPFGTSWNVGGNFQKGYSFREWVGTMPTIKMATTLEVPYAVASGQEVNQHSARGFGHDLVVSLYEYLSK